MNEVKRAYIDQAEKYSAYAPNSFTWKNIERPALDTYLKSVYRSDATLLDIGCGTGRTTEHLIQKGVRPENIVGIDLNIELLKQAKKKSPKVKFVQADIGSMHFQNSPLFDGVSVNMVFEYLDPEGLRNSMATISNALKDNGILVYVATHPMRMVHDQVLSYQQRRWIDGKTPWGGTVPLFHRTVGDYVNETIRAGLTIDAIDEINVHPDTRAANPETYDRYANYGATRLVVSSRK